MSQYDLVMDREMTLRSFETTQQQQARENYGLLKKGIWLYVLLLLFEGALRKWLLPGFSPLLLIRDPLAIFLIFKSRSQGLLKMNAYIVCMFIIAVAGIYTAILFGHGNIWVALYGARILLIHFPLIFVIGNIFSRNDVIAVGRMLLLVSIPMVILTVMQFYSPQSAWVNRSVTGDEAGAGFAGALGFFRPPGTFSFTNGNALFFSLVASFVFYFWFNQKEIKKLVLWAATAALLVSVPFSISRTLFFEVALSAVFAGVYILHKPQHIGKMLLALTGIVVLFILLSNYPSFQLAVDAFTTRFDSANENEGGINGVLGDRYLGTMIGAITGAADLPFFGYGMGMGTSVGAVLIAGKSGLILAEDEWARNISELGLLMGFSLILVRLLFFIKLAFAAYKKLSVDDLLPWMLVSFGIVNIPQGQWAQPTALGFGIVIAGLLLASLRNTTANERV